MDPNTILLINTLSDMVIRSIAAMQQISGKTQEEVMAAILDESEKTDVLLAILK